jgi:hypothetical protein
MPREPSAAPYHDWNARIHAESYRSNAFARINDAAGRIVAIVNNYERLSFNFGPTLARWLGRADPQVSARLRAADEEQRARLGQRRRDGHGLRAPDRAALHPGRIGARSSCGGWPTSSAASAAPAEGLWLPETGVSPGDARDADRPRA